MSTSRQVFIAGKTTAKNSVLIKTRRGIFGGGVQGGGFCAMEFSTGEDLLLVVGGLIVK